MATYEMTFYSREDLTFGRDAEGNYTVTIHKDAAPQHIKIEDHDKGDGAKSFDSARGHEGSGHQTVSGEVNGMKFDQAEIQPVASMDLVGDPDNSCFAMTVGDPMQTYGYGFTFDAEAGTTVSLDTHSYDKEPSFGYEKVCVACFTKGVMIDTRSGPVAIQNLLPGDLVWTEQNGYQPLRWIGHTKVAAKGVNAPVLIKAGACGATADMRVSPEHRMLVASAYSELLFNQPKTLVAAKDLVNDHSIRVDHSLETVEYYHILFDRHQIVRANGSLSESFYPDHATLDGFAPAQQQELLRLFPDLMQQVTYGKTAYPGLHPHETTLLSQHIN